MTAFTFLLNNRASATTSFHSIRLPYHNARTNVFCCFLCQCKAIWGENKGESERLPAMYDNHFFQPSSIVFVHITYLLPPDLHALPIM